MQSRPNCGGGVVVTLARRATLKKALPLAIIFIAGCAHKPSRGGKNGLEEQYWTGRISLQIQSEPTQSFFANFELSGNAERAELQLTSPIGNSLGVLSWSPNQAVLQSGDSTKHFPSVDILLERTTGSAIPITALFDWLNGKNTQSSGWLVDLSARHTGRIVATRDDPKPQTRLRVLLDQ